MQPTAGDRTCIPKIQSALKPEGLHKTNSIIVPPNNDLIECPSTSRQNETSHLRQPYSQVTNYTFKGHIQTCKSLFRSNNYFQISPRSTSPTPSIRFLIGERLHSKEVSQPDILLTLLLEIEEVYHFGQVLGIG